MSNLAIRYGVLCGSVMSMYMLFVACGAQFYQATLKDDHELDRVPESASDPTSPDFGLHAPDGWRTLPIHFRIDIALNAEQRAGLTRAMGVWEAAVGKKLFVFEGVHDGVTGDSFQDLYGSLADGVNGHYLDQHWSKTGKPDYVLATTIWDNDPYDVKAITTADIRFNSNFYNLGDSFKSVAIDERSIVDMETLALHELGHLIGLSHINQWDDGSSIMTPALYIGEGFAKRSLSRGDIERVQRIYGCAGAACDVDATLARIDALDRQSRNATAQAPVGVSTTAH